MSNKKQQINDGYRPATGKRGYQPQQPSTVTQPTSVTGGYQPTNQGTNNPSDKPPPKKP